MSSRKTTGSTRTASSTGRVSGSCAGSSRPLPRAEGRCRTDAAGDGREHRRRRRRRRPARAERAPPALARFRERAGRAPGRVRRPRRALSGRSGTRPPKPPLRRTRHAGSRFCVLRVGLRQVIVTRRRSAFWESRGDRCHTSRRDGSSSSQQLRSSRSCSCRARYRQCAGAADPFDVARSYLDKNAADLGVTSADVADVFVTTQYQSSPQRCTHVNLNQRFETWKCSADRSPSTWRTTAASSSPAAASCAV